MSKTHERGGNGYLLLCPLLFLFLLGLHQHNVLFEIYSTQNESVEKTSSEFYNYY